MHVTAHVDTYLYMYRDLSVSCMLAVFSRVCMLLLATLFGSTIWRTANLTNGTKCERGRTNAGYAYLTKVKYVLYVINLEKLSTVISISKKNHLLT